MSWTSSRGEQHQGEEAEAEAEEEAARPTAAAYPLGLLEREGALWPGYHLCNGKATAKGHLAKARLANAQNGFATCALGHPHDGDNQKLNTFGYGLAAVTCYKHPRLSRVVELPGDITGGQAGWHNSTGLQDIQTVLERCGCAVEILQSPRFTFSAAEDLANLQPGDTCLLIGGTGSGKTRAVIDWIASWQEFPDLVMPLVSIALVKNVAGRVNQRLERLGVEQRVMTHLEARAEQLGADERRHIVTCPESFAHLDSARPYDVFFADEITEFAANLDSSTMISQQANTRKVLCRHTARARFVIAATADPDVCPAFLFLERLLTPGNSKTLKIIVLNRPQFVDPTKPLPSAEQMQDYLKLCRDEAPQELPEPTFYQSSEHPALGTLPPVRAPPELLPFFYKTPRSIVIVKQSHNLKNVLFRAIEHELKVVVFTASKKLGRELLAQIKAIFPDKRVIFLSKDDERLVDAMSRDAEPWLEAEVVIHTGVLSAGVDVSFERPYFDLGFAFFNPMCGLQEHQWQSVDRVRQYNIPLLYVHVGFMSTSDRVPPPEPLAEEVQINELPQGPEARDQLRLILDRRIHHHRQLRQSVSHNDFRAELIRRAIGKGEPVYVLNSAKEHPLFRPLPNQANLRAAEIFGAEVLSLGEYEFLCRYPPAEGYDYEQKLQLLRYQRCTLLGHWEHENPGGLAYEFTLDTLLRIERSLGKLKLLTILAEVALLETVYREETGMGDELFARKVQNLLKLFAAMHWSLLPRKPTRRFDCSALLRNEVARNALAALEGRPWSPEEDPPQVQQLLAKALRSIGCSTTRRNASATKLTMKKKQYQKFCQLLYYASRGPLTLEALRT
jgi:hypothetical protein